MEKGVRRKLGKTFECSKNVNKFIDSQPDKTSKPDEINETNRL